MCEPDPKLAVAAFRSVDFDYTRQLKSVWTDPHYHVSEINRAATDDIMDYFQSRMRNATGNAPLAGFSSDRPVMAKPILSVSCGGGFGPKRAGSCSSILSA